MKKFLIWSYIIAAGVLIGLKLDECITWSWLTVLAPIWLAAIGVILFYGGAFTFAVFMIKRTERATKRKYKEFLKSINENENETN